MRLTSILTLLTLSSAGLAQSTTIRPENRMGVFAMAGATPVIRSLPSTSDLTAPDPLSVVVEALDNGQVVAHARTKASLRLIEDLPALRIYEAGYLTSRPSTAPRSIGTTDGSTSVGTTPVPHAWLVRFRGAPGQRVRVHMRLRSQVHGSATVTGRAAVDVGNDGSAEFTRALDGKRFLGNHAVTLDSTGNLEIRVETSALLTGSIATTAGYAMTFDVSLEPVQGVTSSFSPVGPVCGADLYGISWVSGNERFARLVLENAPANAPAFLMLGWNRVDLTLPGGLCALLASPRVMVPTRTNQVGRVIADLPGMPATAQGAVFMQFATLPSATVHFSKSVRFQALRASGAAYDHYDINHILSAGQSLAMGGLGAPVLSTTQRHGNFMFEGGLRSQGTKFVPLVEDFWETMSSGMSSTISELHRRQHNNNGQPPARPHNQLVSIHAQPGFAYSQLRRGTPPFADGLNQLRLAQLIADGMKKTYTVRCVTAVHGEEDHQRVNSVYARDLMEWQRDYEAEIQARGQTTPVPMFHSQLSSYSAMASPWSFIPTEQLKACETNSRKIVLVGPKYTFDYIDGVHLTSASYRHMGEYYGKAYAHVILEGSTWEPLRPVDVRRNGAVIRVRFHVPEPPLVFDTTAVSDPGNFGFEYTDSSGAVPKIQRVAIVDEDTVEITLSAVPSPTAAKLISYAYTGIMGNSGGPRTGARGNLRDSDQTPSLYQHQLFNWCVHFQKALK